GRRVYGYGGDFDDRPNDGDFSGNGICFGNGEPTPKMQEVKYNYRNIEAEVSREGILLRNRHMFRNTRDFECIVILEKEGQEIRRAVMDTDVEPLSEKAYGIPFVLPEKPGEYAMTVSFRLKEGTPWGGSGI
ncbi:MAG: DUF4981 domain-containing protein, partial [Clostridia bacterium]|nr:DUF4981 domain-containing protein [Clostridia bacterium]